MSKEKRIDKFELKDCNKIGTVSYVDTTQILVDIENNNIMSEIIIGNIVAIETTKDHVKIIGLIDQVIRKIFNDNSEVKADSDIIYSKDTLKVNLIGTYKAVDGNKKNVFKRGIDTFPQISSLCHIINSNNLQFFMNILTSDISKKTLDIGNFSIDEGSKAILDGNKFFQRHAAILGSTGSGKSWCVASLLEKISNLEYPNVIVLDMHGEYKSLCEGNSSIADYYKIAGPGDLESDEEHHIFLPYWLLNRDELLSMVLDRSDSNAPNQASRFTLHIGNLKQETLETEKRNEVLKSFTVDSPIPFYLESLISLLKKDDTEKGLGKTGPIKGEWEGKLTRFISRLETKTNDKRYGFMFKPLDKSSNYKWLHELISSLIGHSDHKKGIKIIDFSEVPFDILPVVTGIISRLLFDIQVWLPEDKRLPFCIMCDEAHLYLPTKDEADSVQKQALYNFERISKEGRKYGISLVTISQRHLMLVELS